MTATLETGSIGGGAPNVPALNVTGVSKTFASTCVLNNVSLQVLPGQVHAVVGQNGSGKSTLVKVLSGYHSADPGANVQIAGVDVAPHDPHASAAAGLRFVHQDLALVDSLNTVENLALGVGFSTRSGRPIDWKAAHTDARRRLNDLGYRFDTRRPVKELLAAERTGIAIARALADLSGTRMLILDEPTATLPPGEVETLFSVIERVTAMGIGVLYISHRLDEIFRVADVVTVLRDGDVVATLPVDALTQDELIDLMVGDIGAITKARSTRRSGEVALTVEALCGTTLVDINWSVRRGEVLGVAGLTGSGREELMPMIFGAKPRSGKVTVGDQVIAPLSIPGAIQAGVGMVPADRLSLGGIRSLTVRDNCTLTDLRRHSSRSGWLRRDAERAEVMEWIEAMDVRPPRPEAILGSFSGGNQQKIALAKWLRLSPSVLLLDEPTQGVDVGAKKLIHEMALKAADDGAAVVIASTDELELCDTADRVIVLSRGRIAGELVGSEITARRIHQLQN